MGVPTRCEADWNTQGIRAHGLSSHGSSLQQPFTRHAQILSFGDNQMLNDGYPEEFADFNELLC